MSLQSGASRSLRHADDVILDNGFNSLTTQTEEFKTYVEKRFFILILISVVSLCVTITCVSVVSVDYKAQSENFALESAAHLHKIGEIDKVLNHIESMTNSCVKVTKVTPTKKEDHGLTNLLSELASGAAKAIGFRGKRGTGLCDCDEQTCKFGASILYLLQQNGVLECLLSEECILEEMSRAVARHGYLYVDSSRSTDAKSIVAR